ncbi:class I SAM-dependent methyltransferase [Herbaspirillum lusitanum]|uniref:Class I SAM-dependent methyltransferase n=1 Tax=Herbaspirillum lusitanum TaxID=213312 RepID=A0ABW9A3A3_9BURK
MSNKQDDAIHRTAADGYTVTADNYVRGRPGYPPEVMQWLRDDLLLSVGKVVLDLGAGTGKFTAYLARTGAHVIAVEPVEKMRDKLVEALPQVRALAGTAEAIPMPDASVDAIVCAQAFHWFASTAALQEIQRVLKPGGCLGLIWNMRDARVGWVQKLDSIVNQVEGDTPRYRTGAWRKVFPFAGLSMLQERHFAVGHTGPAEDVILNRVRSTSFIAALPSEQLRGIEEQIRTLIANEPELAGKAQVTVPYETAAFCAIKTG